MKRWLIIAATLAIASGCLPTREQFPFGEEGDNNVMPDGGTTNNVMPDGGTTNNVTPDGGTTNNVMPDGGTTNNVTPDMGTPDMETPDMGSNNTNSDMCVPEDDTTFCMRQGAGCGTFTSADNCGAMRTVDCGTCPNAEMCTNNVCEGCTPEDDTTFCDRYGAECGLLMELDNCRMQREVFCGDCMGTGVGCNLQNTCIEVDCRDMVDNDGVGGADCDDPSCLGQQCANSPNKLCQADGTCN